MKHGVVNEGKKVASGPNSNGGNEREQMLLRHSCERRTEEEQV